MRFDLLSLKLFVAVCEQQNISRVADAEHIAASAVSKRMSDMERMLGTALFYRSNKGLELTPAAHTLLRHAHGIIRNLMQMESELLDHAMGVCGQVRLHASVSTIVQYLPADISRFLHLHPAVRIDLEEGLSQDVLRAVSENAADIGIFGGTSLVAGLRVLPYRSDHLMVIMPADHPLAALPSLSFDEVAKHDLIGPQKGSYLDSLVLRAAADLSHPLRLRIRVNGFEPVRSMVEAKLGIGLVPEHHAERYVGTGALVAVPLDEPWAVRHWRICTRDVDSLPAPVQLLVEHLSAQGERSPPPPPVLPPER
ncbi:DNA-binding transcriptional regulator, LysR family [Azospirillum oryzae]|uniref:DNA-binding transcriptional regulator, LysR family n=1 Tax=Azospirillum oryzae TaxID=286727 RepID=A0A1X7HLS4_9PROT|nr:LysR family transcriptional regulator [Azospirillum oryzae]SMF88600.1 DNA-binding transcriptional regulator, LysR family [Azospirillum oryzae]